MPILELVEQSGLEEDPKAGFVVMKNVSAVVASRLHKARLAVTSALAPGLISHG